MYIEISNGLVIGELTGEQRRALRNSLTYDNPKYLEAVQFKRRTYGIPKYIRMYDIDNGRMVLPRGALYKTINTIGEPSRIIDKTVSFKPVDIQTNIELRPLQAPWVDSMLLHNNGVGVAPPGSGKTVKSLKILAEKGQPSLWLTHRQFLVDQVIERIGLFLCNVGNIGVIGGGRFELGDLITVGMVQTLAKRDLSEIKDKFGLIIVDECVHVNSIINTKNGYKKAVDIVIGDEVLTVNGYKKVLDKSNINFKPSIKITTLDNTEIIVSEDHPVAIYNVLKEQIEYKEAKYIQEEDILITVNSVSHKIKGNLEDYLFGLFIGDGSRISKKSVRFAFRKDLFFWLYKVPSLFKTAYRDAIITRHINKRGDRSIIIKSKLFNSRLNGFGINPGSKTHSIPWIYNNISLESFIGGMYDREGSIVNGIIRIDNTNITLMKIIHRYLTDIGIKNKYGYKTTSSSKHSDIARVVVSKEDRLKFFDICSSFMSRKREDKSVTGRRSTYSVSMHILKNKVTELVKLGIHKKVLLELSNIPEGSLCSTHKRGNKTVIDGVKSITLEETYDICKIWLDNINYLINSISLLWLARLVNKPDSYFYNEIKKGNFTEVIQCKSIIKEKIQNTIGIEYIKYLYDNNIDITAASKVEPLGPKATVNFTVSENNTFVCDGILTHNCHNIPCTIFNRVARQFNPKYLYGLTATPYREDGLDFMIFDTVGPIIAYADRQEVVEANGILPAKIKVRYTKEAGVVYSPHIHSDYNKTIDALAQHEGRNNFILLDILTELFAGNKCFILTTRVEHGKLIQDKLKNLGTESVHIHATVTKKQRRDRLTLFRENKVAVLIATYALLKEGFDDAKSNRGFFILPRKAKGSIDQAKGRTERVLADKEDAIIYEYVDPIPMLMNQFEIRCDLYHEQNLEFI